MALAEHDLVVTPDKRLQSPTGDEMLHAFDDLCREIETLRRNEDQPDDQVLLVCPGSGKRAAIPPSVFHVLRVVVHHMSRGEAISLSPLHTQLTTQSAADLLGVSRPFLVKLLDQGVMPFTRTGTHRRIKLQDVLDYKERRDREALEAIGELAQEAQQAGDYFG